MEPASSAAGDGGNGGAGRDGGAGGADDGDGSIPPEPKKQKVSSDLEERRLKRLAKSKASDASSSPSPVTTVRRSAIIKKEMRMFLAEDPHLEENDFSLLQFGCVGESPVPAPRRVKSKQDCRIWRSLLGYTTGLSLPVARRKGIFSPFLPYRQPAQLDLTQQGGATDVPSTQPALHPGGQGSPRRHRSQQSSGSSVQRESCASGGGNGEHGLCLEPMNL